MKFLTAVPRGLTVRREPAVDADKILAKVVGDFVSDVDHMTKTMRRLQDACQAIVAREADITVRLPDPKDNETGIEYVNRVRSSEIRCAPNGVISWRAG